MAPRLTKLVLLITGIFFIYEIGDDILSKENFSHYFVEAAMFALIFFALLVEFQQSHRYRAQINQHELELGALKGKLATIVQDQFGQWSLSKSEQEVAWLVIKGFSFNEIAAIRNVTEKTVRQQASAAYKKSGSNNRADFTAGFLNDILHLEDA